ncbi:LacI family DNA-binding transcriptional regulator [Georgenia alba]|uniref:LacI family DNA-binding transcriptional regulator n=1 Tax=Georgenia alba TaxID=2233858 RepID=A0ABW2QBN6_9MICO
MNDVARAVGVSAMTVSNVVNGRPGVGEEVRRRVEAELARSGYRMNVSARNLRAGRSGVIGLAVPTLDSAYFGHLGTLVTTAAADHGYRVVVEETGAGAEREMAAIALSRALDYDGLILSAVRLEVHELGTPPIVLLGERELHADIDHITLPNRAGAKAATELMLARGCRRIAFVGVDPDEADDTLRPRLEGYVAALDQAGIAGDPELIVPSRPLTMAEGRRSAARLRESGADAAVVVTDELAIGVLRGLADHGLTAPDDILLAAFDDIPQGKYTIPSITTVAPDHDWTARRAVELLVARVEGERSPGRQEVAPFELVERESTRPGPLTRA